MGSQNCQEPLCICLQTRRGSRVSRGLRDASSSSLSSAFLQVPTLTRSPCTSGPPTPAKTPGFPPTGSATAEGKQVLTPESLCPNSRTDSDWPACSHVITTEAGQEGPLKPTTGHENLVPQTKWFLRENHSSADLYEGNGETSKSVRCPPCWKKFCAPLGLGFLTCHRGGCPFLSNL